MRPGLRPMKRIRREGRRVSVRWEGMEGEEEREEGSWRGRLECGFGLDFGVGVEEEGLVRRGLEARARGGDLDLVSAVGESGALRFRVERGGSWRTGF